MLISQIRNNLFFNNNQNKKETPIRLLNLNIKPLTKDTLDISFGGYKRKNHSLENLRREFAEKNTPVPASVKILMDRKIKEAKANGTEPPTLYDVQLEAYEALLSCKTLDEAKEKFRDTKEFNNVKDASKKKITRQNDPLKRFTDGKISGRLKNNKIHTLSLETLSLDLIKFTYAQNYTRNELAEIFNLPRNFISDIFSRLNIPRLDKIYVRARQDSNGEILEQNCEKMRAYWTDERRQQEAERSRSRRQNETQAQKEQRIEAFQRTWNSQSPEKKAEIREKRSIVARQQMQRIAPPPKSNIYLSTK